MNLYQEEILEHYKNPHNKKKLANATISKESINPLCGDALGLDLVIKDGKIIDIGFWGEGCAISQAAMSMLTDTIINQPVEVLRQISEEDLIDLLGVTIGPARLKCALLPLSVITKIIAELD